MHRAKTGSAYLILEDGFVYEGFRFGGNLDAMGEVVFTTSMNGYVESLTDPSYKGQILTITHPLVGNYGVPKSFRRNGILTNFESERIQVSGLIVEEITKGKEWNAEKTLEQWLTDENVAGIYGIDTRALTLHLRENGSMAGIISGSKDNKSFEDYEKINFVERTSVKKPIFYDNKGPLIAVVDYGLKEGILDCIYRMGYSIVRLPYNTTEDKLFSYNPAGIVLTNGPGNPKLLENEVHTVAGIIEHGVPTLGICLGHQLIAMASGMEIKKMQFGHRAINKGVIDLESGKCMITTHNHGYAVYGKAPNGIEISHISLDDRTIEGIRIKNKNVISVQFHPEARPGAKDGLRIFEEFDRML
jgi:carbamoyl-phosphate synthase small subunit